MNVSQRAVINDGARGKLNSAAAGVIHSDDLQMKVAARGAVWIL